MSNGIGTSICSYNKIKGGKKKEKLEVEIMKQWILR